MLTLHAGERGERIGVCVCARVGEKEERDTHEIQTETEIEIETDRDRAMMRGGERVGVDVCQTEVMYISFAISTTHGIQTRVFHKLYCIMSNGLIKLALDVFQELTPRTSRKVTTLEQNEKNKTTAFYDKRTKTQTYLTKK